jgi:hypothetical protein
MTASTANLRQAAFGDSQVSDRGIFGSLVFPNCEPHEYTSKS